MMKKTKNVFEAVSAYKRRPFDFVPIERGDFVPTQAVPGSSEKVEVLRKRAEMGMPLWHDGDCTDTFALFTTMTRLTIIDDR